MTVYLCSDTAGRPVTLTADDRTDAERSVRTDWIHKQDWKVLAVDGRGDPAPTLIMVLERFLEAVCDGLDERCHSDSSAAIRDALDDLLDRPYRRPTREETRTRMRLMRERAEARWRKRNE